MYIRRIEEKWRFIIGGAQSLEEVIERSIKYRNYTKEKNYKSSKKKNSKVVK